MIEPLSLLELDPKIRARIFEHLWSETPVFETFILGHPMYIGRGDARMPVTPEETEAILGHGLPNWLRTSKQFLEEGLKQFRTQEVKVCWNRSETERYWYHRLRDPIRRRIWERNFGLLEETIGAAVKLTINVYLDQTFPQIKGLDRETGRDFAELVDLLLDAGCKVKLLRFNMNFDYRWMVDLSRTSISLAQLRKLAPLQPEHLIIEFRSGAHPWRSEYPMAKDSCFTVSVRAEVASVVHHILDTHGVENEIMFDPNDIQLLSSQEEQDVKMAWIVAEGLVDEYERMMRERREELEATQYRRRPEDDPFEYLECGLTVQFDCKKDPDTTME